MKQLTQELLKELLHYDPITGIFTWLPRDVKYFKEDYRCRNWNKCFSNTTAGSPNNKGYIKIIIFNKSYAAHRLAFLYVDGAFPIKNIDHINSVKNDNSFVNLRHATNSENNQNKIQCQKNNKSSGLLGVSFHKRTKKYQATIRINKERFYLGIYATPEEAYQAYLTAKRDVHPFGMI